MAQFGHVIEVHPVNPGDRGGHCQDRGIGSELAGHVALAVLFEQAGGLNNAGQRLTQSAHPPQRTADVIEHVAKPDPRAWIDHRQLGSGEPLADFLHRADCPLEPAKLAAQAENPAQRGRFGERIDRAHFHPLDGFFVSLEDRLIAIDDEIEDRMRDIVWPLRQPLGIGLEPAAQIVMRAGRADPHRHYKMGAQEDRGLAVSDMIALLRRRGARDHKQVVAVHFHLGHLVGAERVFDRQRVQRKLRTHQLHLGNRRIGQPDPVEFARAGRWVLVPIDQKFMSRGFSPRIAACGCDRHGAGVAKWRGTGNLSRNLLSARLILTDKSASRRWIP